MEHLLTEFVFKAGRDDGSGRHWTVLQKETL